MASNTNSPGAQLTGVPAIGRRVQAVHGAERGHQPGRATPVFPAAECRSRRGLALRHRRLVLTGAGRRQLPQPKLLEPHQPTQRLRRAKLRAGQCALRVRAQRCELGGVRSTCATCSTPAPETLKHPPRCDPVFSAITVAELAGSCLRAPAVPFDQPAAARSISSNCVTVRTRDMRGKMRVMNCSWLSASGEVQASLAMTRS